MKLLSRSREEPEINLTSLIDVVLLLLVFFMVTTSFVREGEINIRLPEASTEPLIPVSSDVLEIGITATGNFVVDGKPLVEGADRRTLRRAIEIVVEERGFGARRDIPVIIRGDAESDLQASTTAMSVAGELGFTSINIATATLPDAE